MPITKLPEHWMRGPVKKIPALLQPVAHALLQARDEVTKIMQDFPQQLLFQKPAGMASPAFHLLHLRGVLDRLFTYAKAEQLSQSQLDYLSLETKEDSTLNAMMLLDGFNQLVDLSLLQLASTDENTLTEFRGVGRKQLPSTVMGLLFHAAEHTMRHTGQLLVTVHVLKDGMQSK
ncbi:MAG: DinB family protein [Panacibacter sp.]